MNLLPREEWRARFAKCNECPRFFRPTGQCKECACYMRIKVRIAAESCPMGKW